MEYTMKVRIQNSKESCDNFEKGFRLSGFLVERTSRESLICKLHGDKYMCRILTEGILKSLEKYPGSIVSLEVSK
jgi:hypothetical protein